MADTIARLIFEADTSEIKEANTELKKLATESGKTAKSISDGSKAQKASTTATNANTEATKKANAIKRAEIKAYALQLSAVKKAHINAHREELKRKSLSEKIKQQKAASAKLTREKIKEKEAAKKLIAVQRAEINAYKEAARRKIAAAKASERLAKKQAKLAEKLNKTSTAAGKVKTKTDDMVMGLKKASNSAAVLTGPLGGVSGRLSFLATGLARFGVAGLAAGVGFAAIGTAAGVALGTFKRYEEQMFRLQAVVKATGGAAGFSAGQLNDMAVQAARDTMASAADIRNAQGIMLTFKAVQGDVFKRSIALTSDVGAVMGTTAASGAKSLGKALEDPINNLSALTRNGISFTEVEKDKIKALAESGKLSVAQGLILDKINEQVGGAGTGGGLSAATDLLADNFIQLGIGFAQSSGLASLATQSITGLAKTVGFFADLLTETTDERLSRIDKQIAAQKKLAENERMFANVRLQAEMKLKKLEEERAALAPPKKKKATTGNFVDDFEDFSFEEDDERQSPLQPLLDKIAKEKEAKEKAAADDEKRAADKAEKERVRREEAKAANQLAAEEEMAQAAIFQLQRQDRLTEAALFEKQLKDQLAQQDIDRMVAAGEIEASTAEVLLEAKLERIRSEYDQELEVIEEKEQQKSDARVAREEKELKEKSRLGNLEAQAKIKRDKFEKLTEMQKAKFMTGMATKALGTFAGQSKKMFKLQKAAGIANATITMFEGVNAGVKLGWPMAIPAVAYALGTGMNSIKQIQAQQFGGASSGGSGGGGGGGGATPAIGSPPVQPADQISEVIAPQPINVTVDGSIDPEGARRIIEAINEATEDGLEINALVGS